MLGFFGNYMDFKTLGVSHTVIPADKSRIDKNAKYSPLYKIYTKNRKTT
jgi:hypothetical protein